MAHDGDVECVEEEEEEVNQELALQERLYWSQESASCASCRWAHRSSVSAAAAAADEAAAAAAASRCEFDAKWARADGS